MIILVIITLGSVVGSFLNAVIWRLRVGRSIMERHSVCPHCQQALGFFDLVPVLSFFMRKGRCHYCHKRISWQYPLVEMTTVILFLVFYLVVGLQWSLIWYLISVCFLVIIFVYDWQWGEIPDVITLPAIVIAFVFSFIFRAPWWNVALAALIGGGFFLLQFLISRGRWIGGGDIRLGVLMGALLGWPVILLALFLAYFTGSIVGIFLIIIKKKKMSSPIPFGTFLSVATLIAMLWGEKIIEWYLNIIW